MNTVEQSRALEEELRQMDAAPVEPPKEEKPPELAPQPEAKPEAKEPPERVDRTVYQIPLDKHNRQIENAKKIKEEELDRIRQEAYEKARQELAASPVSSSESTDEEIARFAQDNDLDENLVSKLVQISEKRVLSKIPKSELPEDYKEQIQTFQKARALQEAQQKFDEEFNTEVLPQLNDVSAEDAGKIKAKLDELAFSPEFNTYKLSHIFAIKREEFLPKAVRGIEGSRGGSTVPLNFNNMTAEQISRMSIDEFKKYDEWERSQLKGSRYSN